MFSAEQIMDRIEFLADRQWERLYASKEKADTFLARPEEVAATAELAIYRAILKDLITIPIEP